MKLSLFIFAFLLVSCASIGYVAKQRNPSSTELASAVPFPSRGLSLLNQMISSSRALPSKPSDAHGYDEAMVKLENQNQCVIDICGDASESFNVQDAYDETSSLTVNGEKVTPYIELIQQIVLLEYQLVQNVFEFFREEANQSSKLEIPSKAKYLLGLQHYAYLLSGVEGAWETIIWKKRMNPIDLRDSLIVQYPSLSLETATWFRKLLSEKVLFKAIRRDQLLRNSGRPQSKAGKMLLLKKEGGPTTESELFQENQRLADLLVTEFSTPTSINGSEIYSRLVKSEQNSVGSFELEDHVNAYIWMTARIENLKYIEVINSIDLDIKSMMERALNSDFGRLVLGSMKNNSATRNANLNANEQALFFKLYDALLFSNSELTNHRAMSLIKEIKEVARSQVQFKDENRKRHFENALENLVVSLPDSTEVNNERLMSRLEVHRYNLKQTLNWFQSGSRDLKLIFILEEHSSYLLNTEALEKDPSISEARFINDIVYSDLFETISDYANRTASDVFYRHTKSVVSSWSSIRHPKYGVGIIAHEIGHFVFDYLRNLSLPTSVQITNHHLNIPEKINIWEERGCMQHWHGQLSVASPKHQARYVEEDWADYFSGLVVRQMKVRHLWLENYSCFLMRKSRGYYITRTKNQEDLLGDDGEPVNHSHPFIRLLNVEKAIKGKLPNSCQTIVRNEKMFTCEK